MISFPETGRTIYQSWSRAVTSLLECQRQLLEAQLQAGRQALEETINRAAALRVFPAEGGATRSPILAEADVAAEARRLEQVALDRARQGLVPPREIYAAPYRNRIDWTRFPEWAKPSDPELFADLAHEG